MALPAYTAPPPGSAAGANPPPTYMDKMVASSASLAARDAYLDAAIAAQESTIESKASLSSPEFIDVPTTPTPSPGSRNTRIANTEWVGGEIAGLAPLESPLFLTNPRAPTPALGHNTDRIATTAFVQQAIANKAPLESPVFLTNPRAPTPVPGHNTDRIATTAFVQGELGTASNRLAVRINSGVMGLPGYDPDAFGLGVDGAAPIDTSAIVVTAEGKAVRLAGEVVLATRAIFPLERGDIYRLDHRLWRSTNTDDEAGDAVTVAVRWFDKSGTYLSSSVLDTYTSLLVGPVESRPHFTSRVAGPQIDITPPALARGFRLTVQHRGTTPRTDVALLRPTRITGGTASLDLGAVEARVDALEAIRPVSSTATVLDDDVLVIEPPSTFGVLRIVGENASRQVWADVMFTTSANAAGAGMASMSRGTSVTVIATGSHLTDGVGTDGKVTIACDFSGAIRVSNRMGGAALRLAWTFAPVGL